MIMDAATNGRIDSDKAMMESLIASSAPARTGDLYRAAHGGEAPQSLTPALRHEEHLPDVLPVLDEMMSRRGFVELENPRDPRLDRAVCP